MRKSLLLTGILILVLATSAYARTGMLATSSAEEEWEALLQYDVGSRSAAIADTVYFGGSGLGNGTVVRGGVWDWEADSGEDPEFFLDGDPVGNQYRDGFTAVDRTTRNGPAPVGTGHWDVNGVYDFEDKHGAYAHRATYHDNDGINDGPDPLTDAGGAWSVWIGTNLYLNPEICGWEQTAGHGDGWSQGIMKQYSITAPAGAPVDISFYHRYAVEAGFDTNWVEVSFDGIYWDQVGTAENPNGVYNNGDFNTQYPTPTGGGETVQLVSWPGGTADFFVRFRFASDAYYSDEGDGGRFLFVWQLDDISLLVSSVPQDYADFETDMGGWQPVTCEGFDFDITLEIGRPSGRWVSLEDLQCPIVLPCPEACGLEGNLLIFCDKDDCDLHDAFQHSYGYSPAFSIGGPENPDIDGISGRLFQADVYLDGGAGLFNTAFIFCFVYAPFDANSCPYEPAGGAPGAGETFNWSRTNGNTCQGWILGAGPGCADQFIYDVSHSLPAEADSVMLMYGISSQCRHEVTCDVQDEGSPFWDNLRFGVYDPEGVAVSNVTLARYSDSFPLAEQAHQGMAPLTTRSDGGHNFPCQLGLEIPPRHVRADTAWVDCGAQGAEAFLRFRVVPGPCQSLANPFFAAFPPNAWHEAQMDIAGSQGTGQPTVGSFMTCFHPDDPNNGVSWGGEAIPIEPCDDILPDGVFSAGTKVYYFFEVRDAGGGVIGTSPAARSTSPIDTSFNYAPYWREFETLPELISGGGCDPNNANDRANNMLIVSDSASGVDKGRLLAFLNGFDIDYDWYDTVGTNYTCNYNGIGRREDRSIQQPRPPVGGATTGQLEPYDVIWYYSSFYDTDTMDDQLTMSIFGGHPAIAMQKLENWLHGCATGQNRFLICEGYGWGYDIDVNTVYGSTFLDGLGTDVLYLDYEANTGDLRRCARITGQGPGAGFDGEVMHSGCPDDVPVDVFAPISGGVIVANFVNSLEDGTAPVDCSDDQDMPSWASIIRNEAGSGLCRKSVTMSFDFERLHDLNCTDECLFGEWKISGGASSPAQLMSNLFTWAGHPIGAPIAVEEPASPALRTQLIGARPNPANPSATITYSLAVKGQVSLKVFDVGGRLVRTLVDELVEAQAEPFEVVWDGLNNAGQRVGSGVFFYQLDAPGYSSAKKLVILK